MVLMRELSVSATDFRVHLKDFGNDVARGGVAVVVSRHGLELGAFVNLDEYAAFLEWRRRQRPESKPEEVEVPDEHPDDMPLEEVERVYRATISRVDDEAVRWRGRAGLSIRARTGRFPDGPYD
jgi:hypothetical protein